jgi:hypothetical protein
MSSQLAFDFSGPRVPFSDEQCETCGGALIQRRTGAPSRFCSYWCHLVENGPDFYTLETITPWLETNRNRRRQAA